MFSRRLIFVTLLSLALSSVICSAAQEDDDTFFTGTVLETTKDHLKISGSRDGKPEERIFVMTAQTKIEGGRIRLKQRVNVRFVTADQVYTAILVIVRPNNTKDKNKK